LQTAFVLAQNIKKAWRVKNRKVVGMPLTISADHSALSLALATLTVVLATEARVAVANFKAEIPAATSGAEASERASPGVPSPMMLRLAKTYKYEIPKAQRAPSAPQSSAPATQSAPPVGLPPPANKGKYRQGTSQAGGRAVSSGSCELCRNSCYVSYRVRSFSSAFVPCMRACWNQLCHR
jgi:hypothetical protein